MAFALERGRSALFVVNEDGFPGVAVPGLHDSFAVPDARGHMLVHGTSLTAPRIRYEIMNVLVLWCFSLSLYFPIAKSLLPIL